MMALIIIILTLLLLHSYTKWLSYYLGVRGLLYYLGMKYNDIPDAEKVKELQDMALKREIKERFSGKY